jgi:hypothetical protein
MSLNCESKERRANQRGHGGGINLQFKMGIGKVGPRFSPAAGAGHAGEPVHQSVAEGGAHRGTGHTGKPEGSGGWGRTGSWRMRGRAHKEHDASCCVAWCRVSTDGTENLAVAADTA